MHAPDPVFSRVAMLCLGTEVYGVGTIQKLYAQHAPGMAFVCFEKGPLWDWLGEQGVRRFMVDGLGSFAATGSSLATLARIPGVMAQARRTAAVLRKLLERERLSIVHTHWLPQQFVSGFVRSKSVRTVWQINNNTDRRRLLGAGVHLNHLLARWGADVLLPASDYIGRNWQTGRVRCTTIRNAAVPRFASPNALASPPVRCVIAGRLEEQKGHHVAVDAVLKARAAGHDVGLDIFGGPVKDNPYYDDLAKRACHAGAADAIRFLGFRTDLRERHQDYHLALQCRIDPEPCSLWVCETLVDGVPCIASATGGTPELVEDGKTGMLYRAGDADDLAEKLIALCRDRAWLASMRVAAFKRGRKHFTVDRMMSQTRGEYERLLA